MRKFDMKGLPVLIGVALVIANYVVQFFPALGFVASTDLLLHLGVIVGILGLLIGDSL